jgi:hypothetical protein
MPLAASTSKMSRLADEDSELDDDVEGLEDGLRRTLRVLEADIQAVVRRPSWTMTTRRRGDRRRMTATMKT